MSRRRRLLFALPLLASPLLCAPSRADAPAIPAEAAITRPDPTSLQIRWHGTAGQTGTVEAWQDGSPHRTFLATANGDDYRADLDGLKANSAVHYILSPYGTLAHSREYLAWTLPPKGTLETETLPMLAVVYTPIHYTDASVPADAPKSLSADDVDLIRRQLEDVRSFYFHQTHGKLNLTWDIETEDTDVGNRPALDAGDINGRFENTMERIFREKGKKAGDYAGAVFLYGWSEGISPEAKAKVYRGQAFAGGTYGWDAPWKIERTPFTLINFNHRADIRWTVTHEFGHQLDSMADYSGYPSLAFNHPDPITDVGVFGEHWDANAWLLSHFPRRNWIDLQFGTRHLSDDADEDGLADNDPTLPMDEKRFGSDPRKPDTDNDGLSDLDEYTTVLGVRQGLNEEMAGPFFPPDPRNADSDGDGLKDGSDPYPQYPVDTVRRYATPDIDGRWDSREWQTVESLSAPGLKADFGLQWDDNDLYVAMRSDKPATLAIDLDADNDGWFAGSDNYRMTVAPPEAGSGNPVISSVIWDWSVFDPTKDPNPYLNQTKDLVKASDIHAVAGADGKGYTVEVAIPMNYRTSLRLYDGKVIGVKLGAREPAGKVLYTLFEPQKLVQMTLKRAY